MNTVQATVYGAKLIIGLLLGRNPVIDAKSTLNERLSINDTARPVTGEPVRLAYLVVGNRGHRATIGDQGIPLISIVDHMANHVSPYNPMPFCIRPTTEDLPLNKRQKYALRREETHGGINYYAYYALRIDIDPDDVNIVMQKRTVEDGVVRIEPFVPTTADLYPEQTNLPNTGAVTTTDVSLSASALLSITLNEEDIAEYINVAKVLYNGDERYAIQSEYLLCTGADRKFTVNTTAGQTDFLDAVGVQPYSFSADHKAVYYNSQELKIDFDIGNQVPLLGTQSIPTLETIGTQPDNSVVLNSNL